MTKERRKKRHLRKPIQNILMVLLVSLLSAGILLVAALIFSNHIYVQDFSNQSLNVLTEWMLANKVDDSQVTIIYIYSDNEKGTIVRQSISPGFELDRTGRLTVYVSKGTKLQEGIPMPDFTDQSQEEINKWMNENNLDHNVTYLYSYDPDIKDGYYIASNLEYGDLIYTETEIEIHICDTNFNRLYYEYDYSNYDVITIQDWAEKEDIPYTILYMPSETLEEGKILYVTRDAENDISITYIVVSSGPKGKNDMIDHAK